MTSIRNIWRSKANPGEEFIIADWQLMLRGPPAWDFATLFLCTKGVDTKRLLKEYHNELVRIRPEVKQTYPYETLVADVAIAFNLFWLMGINIFAGVATAELPLEKEEFTWKQYAGPWFGTQNLVTQNKYDVVPLCEAVLAGTYK